MTNWDTIVANDGPMVWRTLWRLLANRHDVEECFQETFLGALKVSRRQAVDSWPALLCSLATARAMDQLRKRYRQGDRRRNSGDGDDPVATLQADVSSTNAGPVEQAVAAELSERLREALSHLPESQAEMFYLHALCGWSHREIGERLSLTENAVGVAIHRARQHVKELLSDGQ
jgi:RNA polymerase sigma-70 factor (ECF subfamily)